MAISKTAELKKIVYANPDADVANLIARLATQGLEVKASTVSTVRADFLHSLAVLKELNAFGKAAPAAKPKAKKAKSPSRPQRWSDAAGRAQSALEELQGLQEEYNDWYGNMPEGLQSSATGEMLSAIGDLDIEGALETVNEAEGIDLPRGFGKD